MTQTPDIRTIRLAQKRARKLQAIDVPTMKLIVIRQNSYLVAWNVDVLWMLKWRQRDENNSR